MWHQNTSWRRRGNKARSNHSFETIFKIPIVLVRAALGAALTINAFAFDSTTNSGLEKFKRFIESPPVISNLIFRQKLPMGGGARPLDGSFAQSTSFEYFQAKWQTNGLLFRRLSDPFGSTNLEVGGVLVSWSGHAHALFEPKPLLTTWDDRDPSVAGKAISIFYTSHFLMDPLREVLNLGVMYVEIGFIHWQSNHFQNELIIDNEMVRVTGELIPQGNGPPRRLNVHYEMEGRTNDYTVRYGYSDRPPLSSLPTSFTNFWMSGGKEIELDEWSVLQWEFADEPLPDEAFSLAPFLKENKWPLRIYTNDAFYEPKPDGTLKLISRIKVRSSHWPSRMDHWLGSTFYTGWVAINLILFALMLRAKHKPKTMNEPNYEIHV